MLGRDIQSLFSVRYFVHSYDIGKSDKHVEKFKKQLYKLWFDLYPREVRNDSSGFEHVFVGEVRDGQVSGMHNWIQLFDQERRGHLNYKGYIYPRRRGRGTSRHHISCRTGQMDNERFEKACD